MENMTKQYTGASYRAPLPQYARSNSLQNENCAVTDDIVNLGGEDEDEAEVDAIAEAEQLLDQLDLLSSDS